jgi:iron complex transport system substrate-binding protein
VSPEFVLGANPDLILVQASSVTFPNVTFYEDLMDEFMSRTELSEVTAVTEEQVYFFSSKIIMGMRYPIGLLYFAKWLHPDLYMDINPGAILDEMIQTFHGEELEGIYAYPEIVTVVDGIGNNVTVKLPVERIVSINYGVTEILCGLGVEDLIVGRDDLSIFPPSVLEIPSVAGSSYSPNVELLLEVNPDLVIGDTMLRLKTDEVATIKAAGIPVYIESTGNFTRIKECIKNLGQILNEDGLATGFVEYLEDYENIVTTRVGNLTDSQKPTVYLEWNEAWKTTTYASMVGVIVDAGGISIAEGAGLSSSTDYVSPEYVVETNPDVIVRIVATDEGVTPLQVERDEILSRTELSETNAVVNDRVYTHYNIITQGIRYPVGLLFYAKWFHPDLFEDIDPAAVQADLFQQFFGITMENVYTYP